MTDQAHLEALADGSAPVPTSPLHPLAADVASFLFSEIQAATRSARAGNDVSDRVAKIRQAADRLHTNLGDQVRRRLDNRSWTPRRARGVAS